MADDYSWATIATAVKSLFCGLVDLEPFVIQSRGTTARLPHDLLMKIFYHLFELIDKLETKRRFRSIYPPRNEEEQAKFFEAAAKFIENKQLHSRTSVAQLKMAGGLPFRSILASLIIAASEQEIARCKKLMSVEQSYELESLRTQQPDLILDEKLTKTSNVLQEINEAIKSGRDLKKNLKEIEQTLKDKLSLVISKLPKDVYEQIHSQNKESTFMAPILKHLFRRVEIAHNKKKVAMEKIRTIKLPASQDNKARESAYKMRLSQFIREAADKFDTSRNEELESEGVGSILIEYDQKIASLLKIWREELDRQEDELLRDPEVKRMFDKLNELIPPLDLLPLGSSSIQQMPIDFEPPCAADIEKILNLYPNPNYDHVKVMEVTKKYLE